MAKQIQITGKVVFQDIGMGLWGIEDDKGGHWRPVNMPESMKVEGKAVEVRAKLIEEDFSIFMWGEPVELL